MRGNTSEILSLLMCGHVYACTFIKKTILVFDLKYTFMQDYSYDTYHNKFILADYPFKVWAMNGMN